MRKSTMCIFGATIFQMPNGRYQLKGLDMTDGGKRQDGFAAGAAASGGNRPAIGERLSDVEIGRAHVGTPGTNAHLVCRLLPEKKNHRATEHRADRLSSDEQILHM